MFIFYKYKNVYMVRCKVANLAIPVECTFNSCKPLKKLTNTVTGYRTIVDQRIPASCSCERCSIAEPDTASMSEKNNIGLVLQEKAV